MSRPLSMKSWSLTVNDMTDERGFTILEFVIYIALVAIVVGAAVMFALQFTLTQAKASVFAQVTRNGQFSMNRIEVETREADSVDVGASVFVSNPGTLTLVTTNGATNPTVFTVTNGQLTVQQGVDPAIPLTDPDVVVSEFTLENLAPHGRSQHVRVHLKVMLPGGTEFQDIQAEVELDTTVHIRRNDGISLL